jgi:hypothetical protein
MVLFIMGQHTDLIFTSVMMLAGARFLSRGLRQN